MKKINLIIAAIILVVTSTSVFAHTIPATALTLYDTETVIANKAADKRMGYIQQFTHQIVVAESVKIHNGQRPHLSLKYKTPDELHQAF